jgi:cysteine synthase
MKLTGNTPLMPLKDFRIWGKVETHNRTGSIKDRMVKYLVDDAILNNQIVPGHTRLIEATSGNTGIALAGLAAKHNCQCTIIMPKNMSQQRKDMMRAFGAHIIEVADNDFKGAIELRDSIIARSKMKRRIWCPYQFENQLNVDCHFKTTAHEIYDQCIDLELDWRTFIHGSGTGGTMMGIKKYIDNNSLNINCVLTQPAEPNDQHGIQGINDGADFLLDRSLMSKIIEIKTDDAIKRMKQFWEETGILVGISSGRYL